MKPSVLPFFIAPIGAALTVNPVYAMLHWLQYRLNPPSADTSVFPNPNQPWEFVILFAIYGIPLAMVTLALFWLPLRALLVRRKLWSIRAELITSVLCSMPVIVIFNEVINPYLVSFLLIHGLTTARFFIMIEKYKTEN